MSAFLYHEPCPKCNSRNNLGVWADGHKWCFGCGHYIPADITSLDQVEDLLNNNKKDNNDNNLPSDFSYTIPSQAYGWLKSYHLTNEEIVNNYIGWSNKEQMLIFPYYGGDDNELLMWQGRYFPARTPKVFTKGYPDKHLLLHASRNDAMANRIVVIEDAVSAIKVSRVCNSTELLGSYLSMHKAVRLSRYYSHLTLWLDNDKIKEMIKFSERYKNLFEKIDIIVSDKDPKEHSDVEIQRLLGN